MNLAPLQPISAFRSTESIPPERIAGNSSMSESEKIRELSRQFEALLLRQILKEARKPVIPSGLLEESNTADIYNDMINFHLADAISHSDDLGLAAQLERDLTLQHATPPIKPHATQEDAGEP